MNETVPSTGVERLPAGGLVLLSTGAAPSAMQVRHLLRAARGRPILWVAYARDLGVEFGWRLREVRPLDAQTAVEELAHGDDDGSDGLLELMDPVDDAGGPDIDPDDNAGPDSEEAAETAETAEATEATEWVEVPTVVPAPAMPDVPSVARVSAGPARPDDGPGPTTRAIVVTKAQGVARRTVKRVAKPAKRAASVLPPRWQATLQKVLLGRPGGRGPIPGERLADALAVGPLRGRVPELLVACDRAAAAAGWYVARRVPQVTALNGIDPAVRYLEFARASESAGGRVHWQAVVGAGDEHDVLAALPPLDAVRPRVVVLVDDGVAEDGATGNGPTGNGAAARALVRKATANGCDVVVLEPATAEQGQFLTLDEDSVTVRVPAGAGAAARAAILDDLEPDTVADPADPGAAEQLPLGMPRTDEGVHLLVAPANYAGQSDAWARAVREHGGGVQARNLAVGKPDAPFAFPADFPLTSTEWRRPGVRARIAVEAVLPATHVLLEAMRPVLATTCGTADADGWDFGLGRADLDALLRSGRRVALLFHGSEARRPDRHRSEYRFSPFNSRQHAEVTARMTAATERVHSLLAGFSGPIFVSTPDLLDDVPDAIWLPVVVGKDCFGAAPPALQRRRPVVVHAPSNPFLKGTSLIEPVLKRLHSEGLVEYRRLDAVPSSFVTDFVREADVIVDQVVLGNPGVLAAEALAAGRLVVAHIAQHVRDRFPEPPPILEATPDTLEVVLRSVARDPAGHRELAARGPAFAQRMHSGRLSAAALADFLDS